MKIYDFFMYQHDFLGSKKWLCGNFFKERQKNVCLYLRGLINFSNDFLIKVTEITQKLLFWIQKITENIFS
tara:strand:- start:278 stop:490 length:213 start_codon:yes stop_codon:yes gene_type:complete